MRKVAERMAALDSVDSLEDAERLRLLALALRDRSPKVRSTAIEKITEHQGRDSLPLVESMLSDPNDMVRYDAVESVGQLLDGDGVPHDGLRSRLTDRSALVRIQALESLAQVGDRGSLPLVVNLLTDANSLVRSYAAGTIAGLDGSEYIQAIESVLSTETDERAFVGFFEALLRFGKREVYEAFLGLLASPDYRVRCAVANNLGWLPLDRGQMDRAITSLSAAHQDAIGFADRTTIEGVLDRLKVAE